MAPVDFEKDVRERLKSRTFEPKPDSWDKIEQQLDPGTGKAKQNFTYWIAIAAAVIGIAFLIFSPVKNPASPITPINPVVNTDIETVPSMIDEVPTEKEYEISVEPETKIQEELNPVSEFNSPQKIAVVDTDAGEVEKKENRPEVTKFPDLKPEINEAIAVELTQVAEQLQSLEGKGEVTDEEIDALLRAAQDRILNRPVKQGNTVDAMALLNEAEEELDQSFRERVFEKLKLGFDKVRTAVADRNN